MKCLLYANTDWYLYNFRRSLALALRAQGYEVLLVSPPGPYGEKLLALGLRWIAAPMERRSLNPVREIGLLLWLYRLLRRERPDVVHSFTIKCVVYGALAAQLTGAARVNAVAGMGYLFIGNSLRARLLRPFVRRLMRLAVGGEKTRLVLQNPDDVDLFLRGGLASREGIRLDCRFRRRLLAISPSQSRSRRRRAAARAARRAHALGQGRSGIRRRGSALERTG